MIFGYETFLYLFKNTTDEKVTRAVYGTTKGPTLSYLLATIIISTFLLYAFASVLWALGVVLFISCYICLMLIFASRRMGLGLTESGLVYLRLRLIKQKPKEVIVIPFDKIRFLDVKKFLFVTNIKISFIGLDGKFRKLKLVYNPFALGFASKQELNGNFIRDKLMEIQKVLDRGDY